MGKDLDFNAIGDASFMRPGGVGLDHQVYRGYVGKALITFIIRYVTLAASLHWCVLTLFYYCYRWQKIRDRLYKYSLEYEGGGVGDMLFSDFRMRIDNDPRSVGFLI